MFSGSFMQTSVGLSNIQFGTQLAGDAIYEVGGLAGEAGTDVEKVFCGFDGCSRVDERAGGTFWLVACCVAIWRGVVKVSNFG